MPRIGRSLWFASLALACYVGCGSEVQETESESNTSASSNDTSTTGNGGAGGQPTTSITTDASSSASTSSGGVFSTCHDTPPPNAPQPPPLPAYSGGTCPMLAPGVNTIGTGNENRNFILVTPSDLAPGEKLPIVFMWHWLGGDADDFLQQGLVQEAADAFRVIAILPEAKGDLQFTWPFDAFTASQARVDEELTFFDDMLTCVATQYDANTSCVATTGVSAGALWTSAVLASARSEYFSSFVALSGGTGGQYIKPWQSATRKVPATVLWGGSTDLCVVIDFEDTSKDLEQNLTADGHFMVECIHNCGHSAPPFDDVSSVSKLDAVWQFVLDHPYWTPTGTSPYQDAGLPGTFPDWCGIGIDSAVPRMGECTNPQGC